MSFSLIKNIFKKFQYLIKADSFIFKKFMVGNITLSIKKDYYVNIHSLFLLTNYIRYFFTKIFLNNFVHFFNFYFTNHVNYYFYFLDKFFIYRFFWFSYIKYTLRYWTLYNLRSMRLLLPLNSRLKFNYEKEFKKTFLTLSAGLILKFFKIKKKSKKQSKKIFNLLILFLKSFLRFKKYYIMIFFFQDMHKNLDFFLDFFLKCFDLKKYAYLVFFNFKKYKHFILFKKKKSIKKRFQRRLRFLS